MRPGFSRLQLGGCQASFSFPSLSLGAVELSHELTDERPSVILDQVRNGVALRMAVLYLFAGYRSESGKGGR